MKLGYRVLNLEAIYEGLLEQLKIDGKTFGRIIHPLFYTYPYGLRFEIGRPELAEQGAWEDYARSAIARAGELYHSLFAPEDEVLVIMERTPDRKLNAAFSDCSLRRVRAKVLSPFSDDIEDEGEESYFYRYLYGGKTAQIPGEMVLERIVMGEVFGGVHPYYSSCVYFYNMTKGLVFHLYDDRGADLVAFSREALIPVYREKEELLLDWDREEMARKLGV